MSTLDEGWQCIEPKVRRYFGSACRHQDLEDAIQQAALLYFRRAEPCPYIRGLCIDALRSLNGLQHTDEPIEDRILAGPDETDSSVVAKEFQDFILNQVKHHPNPTCRLHTSNQLEICQTVVADCNVERSRLAEHLGEHVDSVSRTKGKVLGLLPFFRDLYKLVSDEPKDAIHMFFLKYAASWGARWVRDGLWPLVRSDVPDSTGIRQSLVALVPQMCLEADSILLKTEEHARRDGTWNATALSRAYHMLVVAAYASPTRACEWLSSIKPHRDSWLLHRFIARGRHLADRGYQDAYADRLKDYLSPDSDEGRRWASYVLCYYGGATEEQTRAFLASGGRQLIEGGRVSSVISETYKNTKEGLYSSQPKMLDANVLRLLNVVAHYHHEHVPRSLNSLRVICQQAAHSDDATVRNAAQARLSKVEDDLKLLASR